MQAVGYLRLSDKFVLPPLQVLVVLLQAVLKGHAVCEAAAYFSAAGLAGLAVVVQGEPVVVTLHGVLQRIEKKQINTGVSRTSHKTENMVVLHEKACNWELKHRV